VDLIADDMSLLLERQISRGLPNSFLSAVRRADCSKSRTQKHQNRPKEKRFFAQKNFFFFFFRPL